MATKKPSAPSVVGTDNIKSIKDAAYRFVRSNETSAEIARFIMAQDPSFPQDVSPELKTDLYAGFILRANELWGQDVYRVGDSGVLIKIANSNDKDYGAKIEGQKNLRQYNVHVAFGLSQQEFGQLKNKDPQEHALIKQWRDKFNKYAFNNLSALKLAARQIANEGKTRERTAIKNFDEQMKDVFDTYMKRCKVASSARSDTTADEVRFKMAVDAFWKVYNAS